MIVRWIAMLIAACLMASPSGSVAPVETARPEEAPASAIIRDHMAVTVQPDGSALVVEDQTVRFQGVYKGFMIVMDASGSDGIEDLTLSSDGSAPFTQVAEEPEEPGTFTTEQIGDTLFVILCAPGEDGERSFRFEYRIKAFARRSLDAARIDFKLVGFNDFEDIESFSASIRFPGNGGTGHYFVHGAMGMQDVALSADGALTLGPKAVPHGECVELDALFPAEWLEDAPVLPQYVLADALREEAKLADRQRPAQPDSFCSDYAGVLDKDVERYIDQNAEALEAATGVSIAFVTVKTTSPLPIEEYAKALSNGRKTGGEGKSILVLLATDDGGYFILKGDGLREILPDRPLRAMWNQYLLPDFAQRDFNAACTKLFDALFEKIAGLYGADLKLDSAA